MDVTRAGRGALTTASSCRCGTELGPTAKFCSECGAPRTEATLRDRYRAMAISLGFEGHMAMAEAMRWEIGNACSRTAVEQTRRDGDSR